MPELFVAGITCVISLPLFSFIFIQLVSIKEPAFGEKMTEKVQSLYLELVSKAGGKIESK